MPSLGGKEAGDDVSGMGGVETGGSFSDGVERALAEYGAMQSARMGASIGGSLGFSNDQESVQEQLGGFFSTVFEGWDDPIGVVSDKTFTADEVVQQDIQNKLAADIEQLNALGEYDEALAAIERVDLFGWNNPEALTKSSLASMSQDRALQVGKAKEEMGVPDEEMMNMTFAKDVFDKAMANTEKDVNQSIDRFGSVKTFEALAKGLTATELEEAATPSIGDVFGSLFSAVFSPGVGTISSGLGLLGQALDEPEMIVGASKLGKGISIGGNIGTAVSVGAGIPGLGVAGELLGALTSSALGVGEVAETPGATLDRVMRSLERGELSTVDDSVKQTTSLIDKEIERIGDLGSVDNVQGNVDPSDLEEAEGPKTLSFQAPAIGEPASYKPLETKFKVVKFKGGKRNGKSKTAWS